jgi:hypothetical protein
MTVTDISPLPQPIINVDADSPGGSEQNDTTAVLGRGAPPVLRKRPIVVKIFAALAVVVTVWHVFASFLWIFPPSPLRQLAPTGALSSYMLPMFGQSWTVFAPEPINGDYHFNVRAVIVGTGGEEVETKWVSANGAELSSVINNLFPPRAGIQAEELASDYMNAWRNLNGGQRDVVADDLLGEEWRLMLTNDLEALSVDETSTETDAVQSPVVVEKFLKVEGKAMAYATQVAKAMWGDDVIRVQFRVSRQNVVPFAERNDPGAERPEPSIVLPGWREPHVVEGQDEEAFARVFQKLYEGDTGVKVSR